MNKDIVHPRTAIICMVYNGYEYLSEFILYHLNLADHIFLIDHNSERDLRHLDMPNVTIFRSKHEAQFQSECTNIVIEKYGIKQKFDWLFVLDIDEFLPFSSRKGFHNLLHKHERDRVLQFQWCNGVPFYDEDTEIPKSLIECPSIRFFHKHSIHYKSAVNINATKGRFFVPTGAHHISKIVPSWYHKIPLFNKYKNFSSKIINTPLFHIVAFNKNAFTKKIKNYIDQMKYREHIPGQGGWVVRDYPDDFSGDEWLWYIANFRVSNSQEHEECSSDMFLEVEIFTHLDKDQIGKLRNAIFACSTIQKQSATENEKEYLKHKKDDRDVMENIRWFDVTKNNEIITILPSN